MIYGLTLLYAEVALKVSLSESTTNSPYFLGFIFFLASLLRAFYSVSFASNDSDEVIHQLGAALVTTIVGLPLRQALYAFGPSQADQDLFFRTLEEELRKSASEFRRSQVEMVTLIQEFVAMRRELLAEEQSAIQKYVKSLSKATSFLDGSLNSYPAAISEALTSCTKRFADLDEQLTKFADATNKLDASSLDGTMGSVAKLGSTIKELTFSIAALDISTRNARQATDSVPEDFQLKIAGFSESLSTIPTAFRQQIEKVKTDIDNIDRILDEFVVLLQSKFEAIR